MPAKQIDTNSNFLVPKHELLSKEEKEELLKKYNVSTKQLPKIKKTDPAIKEMDLKIGEIVKITRNSETAGEAIYYRCVID